MGRLIQLPANASDAFVVEVGTQAIRFDIKASATELPRQGHSKARILPWSLHYSDDEIDDYAIGKPINEKSEPIEEHLLHCNKCQDKLALSDAIRTALSRQTVFLRLPTSDTKPKARQKERARLPL